MKVSELTGAQLDYWVARAEGIPAEDLFFHRAPYTGEVVCASRHVRAGALVAPREHVLNYSTDWAQGWPLVEKYNLKLEGWTGDWIAADASFNSYINDAQGPDPLIAICRAVVRAAFGDEVEEVAVCP